MDKEKLVKKIKKLGTFDDEKYLKELERLKDREIKNILYTYKSAEKTNTSNIILGMIFTILLSVLGVVISFIRSIIIDKDKLDITKVEILIKGSVLFSIVILFIIFMAVILINRDRKHRHHKILLIEEYLEKKEKTYE